MKTMLWGKIALLVLGASLLMLQRGASAAESEPENHYLTLRPVMDGRPGVLVWSLGGYGDCSSLGSKALRLWVARQPHGTRITFSLGCVRHRGQKPYLAEISDFARFCAERKVVFTTLVFTGEAED